MDGTEGKPMWVTYRDGVYDITRFRSEHPGGSFIDQAAGGQLPLAALNQQLESQIGLLILQGIRTQVCNPRHRYFPAFFSLAHVYSETEHSPVCLSPGENIAPSLVNQ